MKKMKVCKGLNSIVPPILQKKFSWVKSLRLWYLYGDLHILGKDVRSCIEAFLVVPRYFVTVPKIKMADKLSITLEEDGTIVNVVSWESRKLLNRREILALAANFLENERIIAEEIALKIHTMFILTGLDEWDEMDTLITHGGVMRLNNLCLNWSDNHLVKQLIYADSIEIPISLRSRIFDERIKIEDTYGKIMELFGWLHPERSALRIHYDGKYQENQVVSLCWCFGQG